jgi:hypothetical protein
MRYESPQTLFQQKINNILNRDSSKLKIFEDILKLQQLLAFEKLASSPDKGGWEPLFEVFSTLGSVQFARLVHAAKGRTLSFPTEEEYQDSILTVLCYYYKEIEGMDWDTIKDKLEEPKLNAIKYGIRVRQLKGFIDERLIQRISKEST